MKLPTLGQIEEDSAALLRVHEGRMRHRASQRLHCFLLAEVCRDVMVRSPADVAVSRPDPGCSVSKYASARMSPQVMTEASRPYGR
jgi:hypothetical protein